MFWGDTHLHTSYSTDAGMVGCRLSPADEVASFEIWDRSNLGGSQATTREMLPGAYARAAFARGLAIEAKVGANPWKFGLLGSTDAHTGLSTTPEDNFFGKTASTEPSAERWQHTAIPAKAWAPRLSRSVREEIAVRGDGWSRREGMVHPRGVEPLTFGSVVRRSIQLS